MAGAAARPGVAGVLALPTVNGLAAGRELRYPPGDDVTGAVDGAVDVLGR